MHRRYIAMPPETTGNLHAQAALAAYIRDPEHLPPPEGIEPRRLKIYADLFHTTIDGMLAPVFPVMRASLGDIAWNLLVRGFLREHAALTPLFSELAREFLCYLDERADALHDDPPWLRELAHYEWIELALQISEARPESTPHDPDGDLLCEPPVLSPLAWPLAYAWPVHRIGPCMLPREPQTALLLVRRDAGGMVRFNELSPLTFHLLQRIESHPGHSGRDHLRELSAIAATTDTDAFLADGARMLQALREDGTLLGTLPAA